MKHPSKIILTAVFSLVVCSLFGQTRLSLKDKARLLIGRLKIKEDYPPGGQDTLIDLNGDHFKDILIEYYGLSGSGEKNGVQVYLYNNIRKEFVQCEQMNYLANPTFYRDKKIVVGYYLANGGGYAAKLKWTGLKLDTLEHIDITVNWQVDQPIFKLVSHNFVTKNSTSKVLNTMSLPKEYNYGDYKSIIKTNSR
jgi:hypothetical protein